METVRDIQDGFMGDLYLVVFMCIFAFAILSVFVSIIQVRHVFVPMATRSSSHTLSMPLGSEVKQCPYVEFLNTHLEKLWLQAVARED